MLPFKKSNVDFSKDNTKNKDNIEMILNKLKAKSLSEFAPRFLVLPFFEENYIYNENNYKKIKKLIKDTIINVKDRWVLHNVSSK